MYIANHNLLSLDRVFINLKQEQVVMQAPSIGGSLQLHYWAKYPGHNSLSRLSATEFKSALISWLLCSVLQFLYLLALILTTSLMYWISKLLCKFRLDAYQGHFSSLWAFLSGIFGESWCWIAWYKPIALSRMSRWVAVLHCIRLVSCLRIAVILLFLASSCFWV